MTLEEQIMKLQTYKMFEGEDTVYVERDDVLKLLEQEPCEDAISRQVVLDGLASIAKAKAKSDAQKALMGRVMFFTEQLPPVIPQSKTHMVDKSNFDVEQYKMDLQCAYDCGKASVKPSDDAVSREAVKAYKYHRTMYPNFEDYVDKLPPVTPQQKIGHWIPVSERLPEAGEYIGDVAKYYLVQNEYGDMLVARYTHSEYWEQIYQLQPIGDKIVAWMPLPKPYKAESEE